MNLVCENVVLPGLPNTPMKLTTDFFVVAVEIRMISLNLVINTDLSHIGAPGAYTGVDAVIFKRDT